MVYIRKVRWFTHDGKDPGYSEEADLYITDGIHECVAFIYPGDLVKEGEEIKQPLSAIFVKHIAMSPIKESFIQQDQPGKLKHSGIGVVINCQEKLIKVGEIPIRLEKLPVIAKEGDYVEFKCGRIDYL